MKIMKRNYCSIVSALFLVLLLSACGRDAEDYGYAEWDADRNELLDDNEFRTVYTETTYYDRWDVNNDDFIDENEWGTGVGTFWGDYEETEYGAFEDWDADADGYLSDDEFGEGVFGFYDTDEDNYLGEEEYNTWYRGFNE